MANREEVLIRVFPNGGKYLLNVMFLSLTAGRVHKPGSVAVEKSTAKFEFV